MHAFALPLASLQVEATRFLRRPELRMLHVVTAHDLHEAAVALLLAQELRVENRRPFVVFEQACRGADPEWDRRAWAAREQHAWRRAQMAGGGEALGALPPAPTSTGLQAFAEQLGQLLSMGPEQTEGLMVILAPASIEDERAWQQAIAVLLSLEGLAAIRWIVVERGRDALSAGLAKYDAEIHRIHCRAQGASPKVLMAEALAEPLCGGTGALGAHPRGVTPPSRIDDPPLAPPDPLASSRRSIQHHVLMASQAIDDGRTVEAVGHLRQAQDLATKAKLHDEGLGVALMLGATLLAAGAPQEAEKNYRSAIRWAEDIERPDKEVIAHLALGATLRVAGDRPQALVAYAEGAALAERSGMLWLAVEACRLTGDLAHGLHMDLQAIACWSRAVTLGEPDPTTAPLTGAGLAALSLARLCQERGQEGAAEVFLDKAYALTGIDPVRLDVAVRDEQTATVQSSKSRPETPTSAKASKSRPEAPTSAKASKGRPEAPTPAMAPKASTPSAAPAQSRLAVSPYAVPPTSSLGPPPTEATARLAPGPLASSTISTPTGAATERLAVDDLARLHGWAARESPVERPSITDPTERLETIHDWSSGEQVALRAATRQLLCRETTALLRVDELRALHGEVDLPGARVSLDTERTQQLDASPLEALHDHSLAPQPSLNPPSRAAGLPSPRPKPEIERPVRISAEDLRALRELVSTPTGKSTE